MLITKRRYEQVDELLAQGKSRREVADELGVSLNTVHSMVRYKKEVEAGDSSNGYKVEGRAQKVAELRKQGLTFDAIGEKLGCSADGARRSYRSAVDRGLIEPVWRFRPGRTAHHVVRTSNVPRGRVTDILEELPADIGRELVKLTPVGKAITAGLIIVLKAYFDQLNKD